MAGMDFTWLPQGQDVARLPLGMRVNNPGNIKYNPRLGYAGMLGPSAHTDQGDAQMTFDTPANGMRAMASLLRRKYQRGQRTPMAIIAGQGGWTPGNVAAASNVARTLGIGLNDDIGAAEPGKLAAFMKALTLQEHGAASKLYGDDLYTAAAGAAPMEAGPAMAQGVKQRLGVGTQGGVIASPSAGVDRLKALMAQRYSPEVLSQADDLISSGDAAAKGARSWWDVANTGLATGVGTYFKTQEGEKKKAFDQAMTEGLQNAADAKGIAKLLMSSPDQATQTRGAIMFAEAQAAEQKAAKDSQASFGKTPVIARRGDKLIALQFNDKGQAVEVPLPAGAELSDKIMQIDTGTGTQLYGQNAQRQVGAVPKDLAGAEADKERGKAQEQARQVLPSVESRTDRVLNRLTRLETDPVRGRFTGWQGYGYNLTPTARSYQSLLDEVGGNTFLAAFGDLRGSGAITNDEGMKAQAALTRLQTIAPSDAGFVSALQDARDVFEEIRRNARIRAGLAADAARAGAGDGASSPPDAGAGFTVKRVR